jgi:GT2 family glycosyltransferase
MKILVIIVSYNFMPWIDRCLGSLRKSRTYPSLDVLVVDNGSTDETLSVLRSSYPEVRLIANEKNLGFGTANNIGLRVAAEEHYDAVLLLNQDAWVGDNSSIESLFEFSDKYPHIGIWSPVHLDGDASGVEHGFAAYQQATDAVERDEYTELPFINAAFWYIPMQVVRKVGCFSPLFFHYGEDVDYVNRLHYYGYAIAYAHDAIACHDRAERPVTELRWRQTEQAYLLTVYADVNRSFAASLYLVFARAITNTWRLAVRRQWHRAAAYCGFIASLLRQTAVVYRWRRCACVPQSENRLCL